MNGEIEDADEVLLVRRGRLKKIGNTGDLKIRNA